MSLSPPPVMSVAYCTEVITSRAGGTMILMHFERLTFISQALRVVPMESSWLFLTLLLINGSHTLLETRCRIVFCQCLNYRMEPRSMLWCITLWIEMGSSKRYQDSTVMKQSTRILCSAVSWILHQFIFFVVLTCKLQASHKRYSVISWSFLPMIILPIKIHYVLTESKGWCMIKTYNHWNSINMYVAKLIWTRLISDNDAVRDLHYSWVLSTWSIRIRWFKTPSPSHMHDFRQVGYGSVTRLSGMMTSSNGNIFRVTGHLCGEFTGPRWIPRTKASDAELSCFLCSAPE